MRVSILALSTLLAAACAAPPPPPPPAPAPPPTVAVEPDPVLDSTPEPEPEAPPSKQEEELRMTDSGLGIVDLREGDGAEAVEGKRVTVHYVGTLDDGSVFESSREHGTPFTFELGAEQVIPGWEEGIAGMKVGGLRRLIVPPKLAYGAKGQGSIPGNAIIEFEVELLGVE